MTDVTTAPVGAEGAAAPVSVITPAADTPAQLSPHAAAKALAELRWKNRQPEAAPAAPEQAAAVEPPATDPAQAETADPETPAPGEIGRAHV